MAVRESLQQLGVNTATLRDIVEGVNVLLLPSDQKRALLARYESEEGVTIPNELMALVE